MSTSTAPRNDRWPPQIKYIVGNEAAERFSYYGMKGILALYITNVLLQTKDQATNIIHIFGFVNYFMPILGAWVSDRMLGRYKTILWISLAYCVGHGVLALSDAISTIDGKLTCLYIGLGLIAFGSGGIKPCVSAFMGDQFKADQGHLLQKAYAAFYFSINFGSFFAFLIIPWIRKEWGYSWAFGVPGIFMAIATLVFWLGTRHYVMMPPARLTKKAGFMKVFWHSIVGRPSHVPDEIWRQIRIPAVGLMMIGIVGLLFGSVGFFFLGLKMNMADGNPRSAGAELSSLAVAVFIGLWLIQVILAIVVFLGGLRLKNLESRWLTVIAALLALVPFGIWSLNVLSRREVVNHFTKRTNGSASIWNPASARFSKEEIDAASSLGPILSIFALLPVFWALFDQTFSTWVLQGEKMVPYKLGTYIIGPEEMLSANPLLVLIFVPVMTLWLYPLLGKLVTPLRRMSCGMFLSGLSFVVVAMLQQRIEAGEQVSVLWQFLPYIILTIAEVLVSTTGLEFAFSQAASTMKSTIMGFWYLAVAFGNLLVSFFTKLLAGTGPSAHDASVSTSRFMMYAIMTFFVAILFSVIAMRYRYRDAALALQPTAS